MKTTSLLLSTLKEVPADAEIVSHRLMLRAGLIRRVAAGIYTWLPAGLRVLRKIETLIRDEMDHSGAREVLMPAVQPAELWEESGRWGHYGAELLRMEDRHQRAFCVGPTHEEVITDLVRRELRSYKQLPLNLYQIQTKFRDEIRPRFGVMRAREFVMKDAYSFHLDEASLEITYGEMHAAYHRILQRMGLDFDPSSRTRGTSGGEVPRIPRARGERGRSHRLQRHLGLRGKCRAGPGPGADGAAAGPQPLSPPWLRRRLEALRPSRRSSASMPPSASRPLSWRAWKALWPSCSGGITPLTPSRRRSSGHRRALPPRRGRHAQRRGASSGFHRPRGLDHSLLRRPQRCGPRRLVCGAGALDQHHQGVNWDRDVPLKAGQVVDLRNVEAGDPSPDGQGVLQLRRGIEVGHIFQLGTKYAAALGATVQDAGGTPCTLTMGCYGMGVSRLVGAVIEQCHDDAGILWPEAIAPFQVALVPVNYGKSEAVREAADALYAELRAAGVDVLLDDRDERPGVKFADMELLGLPHRIVIGDRGLKDGVVEYQNRRGGDGENLPFGEAKAQLLAKLQG